MPKNSKSKTKFLDFSFIKGDLFGGLTAGIVALPLALAFGVQSGLGAEAGLFGAIFIGFFASLFGGTPSQISGPTAPMTAVSMLVIAGIIQANDGNVSQAIPSILIVFFLAGVMQILLGVFRLGGLIKYIPYPVVSGFMSGIGVIILITQLLPLFGYNPTEDQSNIEKFKPQAEEVILEKILRDEADEGLLVLEDFKETVSRAEDITEEQIVTESKTLVGKDSAGVLGALRYVDNALRNISWTDVLLALLTIFIIYGFKWITKAIPSTLVALLVVTLITVLAGISTTKIGTIPSGFPKINIEMFTQFKLGQVTPYLVTAFSLALLGAIDSLLTSVVADNMTKTRHDSNQELIGQGIGNSIASIFGGIPGAGATIRTVVNIDSGGKTKLSGMIAAILLLTVVLILGPYASVIPKAVLAGILITVGIGVMDYKGLKALPSMPKTDAFVLILVLLLTVFWDLIYAVGIGLVISTLMFMKKMADITLQKSKIRPFSSTKPGIASGIPAELQEEVQVKEIEGPLFFGNTRYFQTLSEQVPSTTTAIVIRMYEVPYIDQSGINALENVLIQHAQKGIKILITGLETQPRYMMEKMDIIPDLIPEEQIFEDSKDCVDWVKKHIKNED